MGIMKKCVDVKQHGTLVIAILFHENANLKVPE